MKTVQVLDEDKIDYKFSENYPSQIIGKKSRLPPKFLKEIKIYSPRYNRYL